MKLFDTHAHIHDHQFDEDRQAVVARAREQGLIGILTLGVTAQNSVLASDLARQHDIVWAATGVHPHDAAETTDADLDALEALCAGEHVVAVGEIGLDYYRNLSPRDRQLEVMRRQLETAKRVRKPIAVHARDAHSDMLPLLSEWSAAMGGTLPDGRRLGVMHYFSEDASLALKYVELGLMISVHTSVTHPKADQLREVVRETPLEYLMLETDSPYGAPQKYRGKRNEPAFVAEAAARVAEIKNMTVEAIGEVTTQNALRLFGLTSGKAAP